MHSLKSLQFVCPCSSILSKIDKSEGNDDEMRDMICAEDCEGHSRCHFEFES